LYSLLKINTNGKFNNFGTTRPTIRKQPVSGKKDSQLRRSVRFSQLFEKLSLQTHIGLRHSALRRHACRIHPSLASPQTCREKQGKNKQDTIKASKNNI